ncbi:MAG: class I SAM-dependent methyltransferase [Candidatus Bathyarchaeota archaeon]|jgi:release factor glutamine methyltransferase
MSWSNKKVFFKKFVFEVHKNVYEPAEDSFLFAENLHVKKDEFVLDIGTGCGILAVVAADTAASVVAVDINPYAIDCARDNARLNRVTDKTSFIQCDLFFPMRITEEFDSILFNAPYLPSEPSEGKSWLEHAWNGGITGRQVINRFISTAPNYLKENGCILLMQSTISNVDETLQRFVKKGLKTSIVAELAMPFFEKIVLVKAEKQYRYQTE